jgi:hypothetical protein
LSGACHVQAAAAAAAEAEEEEEPETPSQAEEETPAKAEEAKADEAKAAETPQGAETANGTVSDSATKMEEDAPVSFYLRLGWRWKPLGRSAGGLVVRGPCSICRHPTCRPGLEVETSRQICKGVALC